MNDAEKLLRHFDYRMGEEFTYDGERIEGRICPGVLLTMVRTVWQTLPLYCPSFANPQSAAARRNPHHVSLIYHNIHIIHIIILTFL